MVAKHHGADHWHIYACGVCGFCVSKGVWGILTGVPASWLTLHLANGSFLAVYDSEAIGHAFRLMSLFVA